MPVVECGYVPFFADVLSIYSCILFFFDLRGNAQLISYIFQFSAALKSRGLGVPALIAMAMTHS
jgi:hypothetical protein